MHSGIFALLLAKFLVQIAQLGDKRFENPQTANLHRILVDTIAVHELMVEGEAKPPLEGQRKKAQQVSL
jgi:hypothetical protein